MAKKDTKTLVAVGSIFHIRVNYNLRLEVAIKAGNYDWENDYIDDNNFPPKRSGSAKLDIRLIHFNKDMSSEDVLKELDKMGLRPIELPELLAFGVAYPDEQRKYPVVALGSFLRDGGIDGDVACLSGDAGERALGLDFFDGGWYADCRFAAVSK